MLRHHDEQMNYPNRNDENGNLRHKNCFIRVTIPMSASKDWRGKRQTQSRQSVCGVRPLEYASGVLTTIPSHLALWCCTSYVIQCWMRYGRMTMNEKFKGMWVEKVSVCFQVQFQCSRKGTLWTCLCMTVSNVPYLLQSSLCEGRALHVLHCSYFVC